MFMNKTQFSNHTNSSGDFNLNETEECDLRNNARESPNRQNIKPFIHQTANHVLGKLHLYNTSNNNELDSTVPLTYEEHHFVTNQQTPVQQHANDDIKKQAYAKMFHELMKQRSRSPEQSQQTQIACKKYSPLQLKDYFLQKSSIGYQQEVKKLNQSCSQRLLEQGKVYQLKKDIIGKFDQLRELEECSFVPAVNRSTSPKRNIHQFAKDQQMFYSKKHEKIQERLKQSVDQDVSKLNERHISRGSQKIMQSLDRSADKLANISQQYEKGRDKLKQMTEEEMEIRKYLNEKASWPLQRKLMSSQSLRELRDQYSSRDSSVNSSQNNLFNPNINKKSQRIVRNDSVGNILYQDAMDKEIRLKSKQKKYAYNFDPQEGKKSERTSEAYLINSFCQEFNKGLEQFNNESIENFLGFLQTLGFIQTTLTKAKIEQVELVKESGLFNQIRECKMRNQNLFIILTAILNINTSSKLKANNSILSLNNTTNFEDDQINGHQEMSEYLTGINNTVNSFNNRTDTKASILLSKIFSSNMNQSSHLLELSNNDIKSIHKAFLPLYYQRLDFQSQKRKSSNSPKAQQNQKLFKPLLNNKSMKMADKLLKKLNHTNMNNSKHFDILLTKGQHYQNKVTQKQKQKAKEEVQQCTFKPQISQVSKELAKSASSHSLNQQSSKMPVEDKFNDLHNEYKLKAQRTDKTTEQIDFEKSYPELTFQPNRFKNSSSSNLNIVTVEKSLNSSRINQSNKSIANKGFNSTQQQSWKKNTSPQRISNQGEPAFIVGIELEGVSFKINLYDGDIPDEVITKFCKERSKLKTLFYPLIDLNEKVCLKIQKLVNQQFQEAMEQKRQQNDYGIYQEQS